MDVRSNKKESCGYTKNYETRIIGVGNNNDEKQQLHICTKYKERKNAQALQDERKRIKLSNAL